MKDAHAVERVPQSKLMKFTMFCSRDDVVLLPISFTDLSISKVRPAIVVDHRSWLGDLLMVPATSRLHAMRVYSD